jgi:predicted  nucleic acid-binding Zn-ribbon protein
MGSHDAVEALLGLQEIDAAIEEREAELAALEPALEDTEERLTEIRQRLDAVGKQMEESEEALRRSQRSVQAGRATLKRLKDRADEVQDLRQHMAVRAELEAARRNLEAAESDALDDLQRVETTREAMGVLSAEMAEAQESFDAQLSEVRARQEELERELSAHRDRRGDSTDGIDEAALLLYERVRRGRTRNALAPLVGEHCGHCFTAVPLQRQAEIRAGKTLHRCEGCGVILHAPFEEPDGGEAGS